MTRFFFMGGSFNANAHITAAACALEWATHRTLDRTRVKMILNMDWTNSGS